MTIGPYIDFTLGGAGSAANISEGVQSGDIRQVAGGAHQGLGAYLAASNAVKGGLPGAASLGRWLPFVGMGLSALNLAVNPSRQGAWYTALSGFSAIPGAAPFALGLGVIAGGIGYMKSQRAKHKKHYIQWHTPKLEVIGQDEEGWTYLYDTNFYFATGEYVGEDLPSSAQARRGGFILRYNPETNELQQTDMSYQSSVSRHRFHYMTPEQATAWVAGEDPGLISQDYRQIKGSGANIRKGRKACVREGGRISTQHVAGGADNYYCVTDHAIPPRTKRHPRTDWKTIDLTYNWDQSGKRDPVITDPSAFQAEIYNKVLLPQGYVDAPSLEAGWSSVTMNGQEFWMDSSGLMADPETGYLLGAANPETGQVIDFSGSRGKSRIRKSTGEIQSGEIPYMGTIDNWDQMSQALSPSQLPTEDIEPSLDEQVSMPQPQPQGLPELQDPFNVQSQQEEIQSLPQGLPGLIPAPMVTAQSDQQMQGDQIQPLQQGLPGFQNPFNVQNNIPMPSPPGLSQFSFPSVGLVARI